MPILRCSKLYAAILGPECLVDFLFKGYLIIGCVPVAASKTLGANPNYFGSWRALLCVQTAELKAKATSAAMKTAAAADAKNNQVLGTEEMASFLSGATISAITVSAFLASTKVRDPSDEELKLVS